MNTIWNHDNVTISDIATFEPRHSIAHGTGTLYTPTSGQRPFEYEAALTPRGWEIGIIGPNGFRGRIQGATFNLALEIASAVKKIGL